MWKHELLPKHSIMCFANDNPEKQMCAELYLQAERIRNSIQNAQIFFFGDLIRDSLYETRETLTKRYNYPPLIKMPYNIIGFEYSVKDSFKTEKMLKSTKRFILVENRQDYNCFLTFSYADEKNKWFVNPFFWVIYKDTEEVGPASILSDEMQHSSAFSDIYREQLKNDAFFEFTMAELFLDILNCNNVITKDVIPPEKLNRKRVRNGKLPLYSYKILEVVKGKPKTKNAGSVPWDYKSPEAVRFHLCRGHFKTFTEERPLFGKYSGTFWWNPQSRGDRSKGVVEKEYSVTQA